MRLRVTRRIRTSNSEQWTLFDADRRDVQGDMENIGKMDLHYDDELVYCTLLLWKEFVANLGEETVQAIVDDLMDEATAPIGVPALYSLDFFTPSLGDYKFYTNDEDYNDDEDEDEEEASEEALEDEEEEEDDTKPGSNGRSSNWP
ncbi:MAG: hypothetical protein J0I20_07100 [Chloroflexi bacterium]|nr:hypothetical protein [Chloroflexota bacterium]OJV95192.1 MAG: hypothetical protein BGO39_24600 [Chloroflexi bacterium 54-19]